VAVDAYARALSLGSATASVKIADLTAARGSADPPDQIALETCP
jgi:hypothetical protein